MCFHEAFLWRIWHLQESLAAMACISLNNREGRNHALDGVVAIIVVEIVVAGGMFHISPRKI